MVSLRLFTYLSYGVKSTPRSAEVMVASEPEQSAKSDRKRPIFLVREDGKVIIPTPLHYPV